jgi:preprotein translocase subunit Sec63
MSLKYSISVNVLNAWSKVYTLYKEVKRRPVVAGSIIGGIILLMAILIYFREPAGLNFDYDPYEVLNVERNATTREVKSAYRRLTATQ